MRKKNGAEKVIDRYFVLLIDRCGTKTHQFSLFTSRHTLMKKYSKLDYLNALCGINEAGITAIFENYSMLIYQLVVKKNNGDADLARLVFIEALEAIRIKAMMPHFELKGAFDVYLYQVCRQLLLRYSSSATIRDFKHYMIGIKEEQLLAKQTVQQYFIFKEINAETTLTK